MKPFARVVKTPSGENAVEILSSFQIMVEGVSKERSIRACNGMNSAHRARVREELEAFKRYVVLVMASSGVLSGDDPKMVKLGRLVNSADIDAFLDREG